MDGAHVFSKSVGASKGSVAFGKRAVKRLLTRMASHVRSKGITRGVRNSLAGAVAPFAAVLFLPRSNVVLVQMLYEVVHILQVAGLTSFPFADGDLIVSIVVFGGHAWMVWRCWHRTVRVLGDFAIAVCRRHVENGGI